MGSFDSTAARGVRGSADNYPERIERLGIGIQPVSGQELARDFPQLGFQVAGGFVLDTAWSR